MTSLDEPLRTRVGDRTAKQLRAGFGLETAEDLLRHYPRRYTDRGELTDLSELREGERVTVVARVRSSTVPKGRPRAQVVVTDGTGELTLLWWAKTERQARWRVGTLPPGRRAMFSGKITTFRGVRQLAHPELLYLEDDTDGAAWADEIIPIYPLSGKAPDLDSAKISKAVATVLDVVGDLDDPVPAETLRRLRLPDLATAFRDVHRPQTMDAARRARDRLRFDEAFVLQVVLAQRRRERRAEPAVPRAGAYGGLLAAFDARLPYELTAGQREVGERIAAELSRDHPMHRLLQGEVGSGKTVVALRAMLQVVDAGGQAALLAPTEVLAQQHHRSITAMLGPLAEGGRLGGADVATRVALLTGSQGTARRRQELLDVVSGDAGIVVGTHALLEERVDFHDLALVVVDEQHRFGVEQRAALTAKARDGARPHVLVMTATPIPRTVAMTVFGDLDVSTLTELPPGRSPVATHVVPAVESPHYLVRAWERVREEVAAGHQAYVVCPRIGDEGGRAAAEEDVDGYAADTDEAAADAAATRPPLAVLDVARDLGEGPLAGLRLGVLHGRMAPDDKDDVMRRFVSGPSAPDGIDVLVSTTVVEVGVDVPNATVMVVMDADRFGVSQLHQLRGRIGRGTASSVCLLVTDATADAPARERLDAVARTPDGFALAQYDLELRREGDVLGASQHGRRSSLRLLEVARHVDVVQRARDEAEAVVAADPELRDHPALARAVAQVVADEQAEFLEKT